mmetsp:Transcript_29427/g.40673  ORF Transcript_29427/g.40673 Transcript_29427/m.40673 type:complete len:180 (-) Transcript_29427:101-640(-)|eukprot:CAMPEP_0201492188 /NCGR_PEP_ID=MMETSP0151_2-20130828/32133_1 /ASSEMBLY_ACC=CAM_ASM_000257 /TAXON_ID=200890 /ORGANISM="Paramoeba atlantica, Strain 621/1 / CCAP 1560/9" /LENGTH=179 /DNA_ID=CAMNT_0047878867 /DNA_START=42 /DNA_END=581 /DNA_ORIENTATION=-
MASVVRTCWFNLSSRHLYLAQSQSQSAALFGGVRRKQTSTKEKRDEKQVNDPFANDRVHQVLDNFHENLNARGLKFPVQPPPQEAIKPSGFIAPFPERHQDYPFYFARTKTFNLPVYSDVKKSGQRFTILRKFSGDSQELVSELTKFIPKEKIHRKSGTIQIQGNYTSALRGWLHGLGF